MKNELIKHDTSDRMVALLADKLRTRILSGELQPDDRLPNWEELSKMFDVSKVTVSKAIKELQEDGFVYSKVKLGTFVCPVFPQTHRYALIINEHKHSVRKTWWGSLITRRHLTAVNPYQGQYYDPVKMHHACHDAGVMIWQWTTGLTAQQREEIRTGFTCIKWAADVDAAKQAYRDWRHGV